MEIFSKMVCDNLFIMAPIFDLDSLELIKAIGYADVIGFQSAKPSSIALAIIRIIKPELSNKIIYKLGKTEFNTLKKWTVHICKLLNIEQIWFENVGQKDLSKRILY
jgi:hypothetical protein